MIYLSTHVSQQYKEPPVEENSTQKQDKVNLFPKQMIALPLISQTLLFTVNPQH
jgi:hypothetical protein